MEFKKYLYSFNAFGYGNIMGVNRIWNGINHICEALTHNENNLLYK